MKTHKRANRVGIWVGWALAQCVDVVCVFCML